MPADADQGMKAHIRALARAHGFDLCRFTTPRLPARHADAFVHWVDAGMQGGMAYMAEASRVWRRLHPESMLPGVRTVITLAMRHSPPAYARSQAREAQGRGVIAAYAHGEDYHTVMKKRLKAFARDLDALLGRHDQRVYVDTAPVLEHALAERSGLGWQGKHSLLIHRRLGSWLLLGELFTTARIAPDAPTTAHCGTCTACLDACPTQAIVAPYVVDARRCISYLTIEHKGYIPRAMRPRIGNRIFGCDDCQMVCPWNRRAQAPIPDRLAPRGENALPALADLLRLDDAAFRARFAKSPIKRTGRARWLRNVCVAAGNSGLPGLIPSLLPRLADAAALVRAHAAWALARLGRKARRREIEAALQQALLRETDEVAREDMRRTIDDMRVST